MRIRCQRKLTFIGILVLLSLFLCCTASAAGVFAGGDGTESNPYQIRTAEQLDAVRNDMDAHYILMEDIDLSTIDNWRPIGGISGNPHDPSFSAINDSYPFTGTFDGNGHIISNIKISASSPWDTSYENNLYIGFFGYTENATIKRLGIDNASYAVQTTKYQCHSQTDIGGIVGVPSNTTIDQCFFNGSISTVHIDKADCHIQSTHRIGGIAGNVNASQITNCYSDGEYLSQNGDDDANVGIGGIVGTADGLISKCYTKASIGINCSNEKPHQNFCYIGGICVAYTYRCIFENCVVMSPSMTANPSNKVIIMEIAGPDAQLNDCYRIDSNSTYATDQSFFESMGWDFQSTWTMGQSQPRLKAFPKATYQLRGYANRPNSGIAVGETIRITPRLYQNDSHINTGIDGYSITIKDPSIIRLTSTRRDDIDEFIFSFLALSPGQTTITITEIDTLTSITIPIETIDPDQYYRCSIFPAGSDYEYLQGLYIPAAEYSCTEQNGRHTISFNIYSGSHSYGVVEAVDKSGKLIRRQMIKPLKYGSGIEVSIKGYVQLYFLLATDVPDYQVVCECTTIYFSDLPEHTEIRITTDPMESSVVAVYNFADIALRAIFLNPALPDVPSSDFTKFTEFFTKELLEELSDMEMELFASSSMEFIQNWDGRIIEATSKEFQNELLAFIEELFIEAGVDFLELVQTAAYTTLNTTITKMLETLNPLIPVTFFYVDLLEINKTIQHSCYCLESGNVEINIINHSRTNTFTDEDVTITQRTFFNIKTILDVYVVVKEDEMKQFAESLTADMSNFSIFNITLRENGEEVQPEGSITVRIPIPEGVNPDRCKLFHLASNTKRVLIPTTRDGNYLVFTTDHLSYYLIGEEAAATADYTAVETAMAQANALIPSDYVDFSGVQLAVNAVVYGLDSTKQAQVDAMAQEILNQIALLVPVTVQPTATLAVVPPPKSGDQYPLYLCLSACFISIVFILILVNKRNA